eukprot:jgi/Bigna1/80907/fgenesh1_pg.75_\
MAPRGQMLAFTLIYISYVAYYIAQKNYAFWLQALIDEEGWNKEEVGAFGSAFQMSSGISKLLNGPLVDSMSSTSALAGSLLSHDIEFTGALFEIFGSSLQNELVVMFAAGVFQGVFNLIDESKRWIHCRSFALTGDVSKGVGGEEKFSEERVFFFFPKRAP